MNKKLLLTLGSISAVVAPIAAVISCGEAEATKWDKEDKSGTKTGTHTGSSTTPTSGSGTGAGTTTGSGAGSTSGTQTGTGSGTQTGTGTETGGTLNVDPTLGGSQTNPITTGTPASVGTNLGTPQPSSGAPVITPPVTPPATAAPVTVPDVFQFNGTTYNTFQEVATAVDAGVDRHADGYTVVGTDKIFETKSDAIAYLFTKISTSVFAWSDYDFEMPGDIDFGIGKRTSTTTSKELPVTNRFLIEALTSAIDGTPVYTYHVDLNDPTKDRTFKTAAEAAQFMVQEFNKHRLFEEQPEGWEAHKTDADFSNIFIPGTPYIGLELPVWESIFDMAESTIQTKLKLPQAVLNNMHESDLPTKQQIIDRLHWVKKGINGLPASNSGLLGGYSKTTFTIPNVTHFYSGQRRLGKKTEDIHFSVYKKDGTDLDIYNDLEFSGQRGGSTSGELVIMAKDPENVKIEYTISENSGSGTSSGVYIAEYAPSIGARILGIQEWSEVNKPGFDFSAPFPDLSVLNIHKETTLGTFHDSRKRMYQLVYSDPISGTNIEVPNVISQILFENGVEPSRAPRTYKQIDDSLIADPLVGRPSMIDTVNSMWLKKPWESLSANKIETDISKYLLTNVLDATYLSAADFAAFTTGSAIDPTKALKLKLTDTVTPLQLDKVIAAAAAASAGPDPLDPTDYDSGQGFFIEGLEDQSGIFSSVAALKDYFNNGEEGSIENFEVLNYKDATWEMINKYGYIRRIINHSDTEYFEDKVTHKQYKSKYEMYNSLIKNNGKTIDSFAILHESDAISYTDKDTTTTFDIKSDIKAFLTASTIDWKGGSSTAALATIEVSRGNTPTSTVYESTASSVFKIDGYNVQFSTRKEAEDFLWNKEMAYKLQVGFVSTDGYGLDGDAVFNKWYEENPGTYGGQWFVDGQETPKFTWGDGQTDRFTGEELWSYESVTKRIEVLGATHKNIYIVKDTNISNWRVYKSRMAAESAIDQGHGTEFMILPVSAATFAAINNEEFYLNAYDAISQGDDALTAPTDFVKLYIDKTTGYGFETRELFKKWFITKDLIVDGRIKETGFDATKPIFSIYKPATSRVSTEELLPWVWKDRRVSGWTIDAPAPGSRKR